MANSSAAMVTDNDDDMYLFTGDAGQTPSAFTGQAFDSFLDATTAQMVETPDNDFLDPGSLAVKREGGHPPNGAAYARGSTSSSSTSSSSDSPQHNRNISTATTTSPTISKNEMWDTGINGMSMPMNEQYFDPNNMAMDQDQDIDLDQQMASAFDFDTAASTPSGFDSASINGGRVYASQPQIRRNPNIMTMHSSRHTPPRVTAAPASFFLGSREASPLNSMLPTSQAPSPWTKHSPSSGLEETFNHMGMNGDSPGNATFSPNMHMNYEAQYAFAQDSSGTPSSFAKDMISPPSTIHSVHSVQSMDGQPQLRVLSTSTKSRVETQIPIRLTLYPLPPGIRKLRLPTHAVSKPKFLAKPEQEATSDTLDLMVSLVCTSAMQDPHRKQRALARARGEDLPPYSRPSPASSTGSTSSKEDEEKPLNGGEVRICAGCIQRERKRASRKKQKKPEEEEQFQRDEEKRVVVFNTNEIKEWTELQRETLPVLDQANPPPLGAQVVELPMRIACYCRHQNEKLGFMVIFTVRDSRNKVISQAMTNSIMITDDHKTHNAPQPMPAAPIGNMPQAVHFPGSAVFNTDMSGNEIPGNKLFKQSYSTPDLTRLQQGYNGQFNGQFNGMGAAPFVVPQALSGTTSATLTPRNLSRPASPSGPSGPASKRRKPSGSGKLPSGLTMTRIETAPTGSVTMPNTAASSPYAPNMPHFMAGTNAQGYPNPITARNFNSPPTPGGDGTFGSINRSFSLENLPRQALLSAPNSRQPSRPGSPLASARNSFGQNEATFPQALNQQLMAHTQRRPPPVIHKLVPSEGSVSGGTEVTLLGNGFYQGLEVMFGDTEATTTTFWGEKCLNCIAPPAVAAGMVSVVFKHEHPLYATAPSPAQVRQSIYTYVDDREIEMLRLALRTIGKQMGTDDPYAAAQQLLQQNPPNNNGMFQQQGYLGMANGHQRTALNTSGQHFGKQELESCLVKLLRFSMQQYGISNLQLNLRRPSGMTLLHFAASFGMSKFADTLIIAGVDVDMLDNNGFTPMHHAAMNGHDDTVSQLRSAGADHRLRSIRNFVPADLATTLRAYQATMRPYQHSRSKSSETSSSRNESSMSMNSFWDSSAPVTESEGEAFDENNSIASPPRSRPLPYALPSSAQPSRRGSSDVSLPLALVKPQQPLINGPTSPSALGNAWRQLVNLTQAQQAQLIGQLQHLQDNIPALPQLPQLDNGMMRRMSLLFPQRSNSPDQITKAAPPSYDELFPSGSDIARDKKEIAGTIQAAAEAAVDQQFEAQTGQELVKTVKIEEKQENRPITQDRRLFFFWIPLFLILIGLMIPNSPISNIAVSLERYVAPRIMEVA